MTEQFEDTAEAPSRRRRQSPSTPKRWIPKLTTTPPRVSPRQMAAHASSTADYPALALLTALVRDT